MFGKSKAEAPPHVVTFAPDVALQATFETSLGTFVCKLFAAQCPMTVGSFVALARGKATWQAPDGQKVTRPLYDGTIFHRVIPEFMIQGGDPAGDGTGGPGFRFADECISTLKHDRPGVLSMANAGPNTNGSQFFVTEVPTPWLDGKHTVFGEVISGMDVVRKIGHAPTGAGNRPSTEIKLHRVVISGD